MAIRSVGGTVYQLPKVVFAWNWEEFLKWVLALASLS